MEFYFRLNSFNSFSLRTGCLLVLGFSMLTSCNKVELDLAPPSLEFLSLTPDPLQGEICGSLLDSVFYLTSENELSFEVRLSDDQALSQFKIDIHNNFDCHGHGGASTPGFSVPSISNQTEDWTILETQDLQGSEEIVTRDLKVPANVTAGNYHLQLQVLDESGNDIPFANFYALKINNNLDTTAPIIEITSPERTFSKSKGQEIIFSGTITDDVSLSDGGNGVIFLSYTDLNSGNTFTTNAVQIFDESVQTSYSFNLAYTIPLTLTSGDYLFTLRGQDGVRNVAEPVEFNVEITN